MALYTTPSAQVFTSNLLSAPFCITNGTRQGCPLSPLIFNLIMEPLAEHIRINTKITGVTIGNQIHKISLFVDDVILMITNPTLSLTEVQKLLTWFGKISYYKANATKSYILDISIDAVTGNLLQHQFPYTWAESSIPYLGIHLTRSTHSLFSYNYLPLRTKLQTDLLQLGKHKLSWWGRLAAFKMIHLPQVLYLFRNLPIPIPTSYFKSLQALLSRFIWQGTKSRCTHSQLIKHRMQGGLGYIDFQDYF